MTGPLALAAALLAFSGIAHCAAMCGGFVATAFAPGPGGGPRPLAGAIALHAGRLASYATAGALAGAVGATPALLLGSARFQAVLFSLGALVLVVTGLRIAGVRIVRPASAAWAEPLWQRATGLARRLGQSGSLSGRLGLGILWGWAPCALVYSALPLALVSGSALRGAAVMLAFGAGTLPALLGAGWLAGRGIGSPGPVARRVAGAALVVLALAGILQAFGIADTALGAFCVPARP
ncbi:MAG TPA: sulfite exporter TauE/SafE family protein [Usitatibacteraceae bacterium]|nr:sulfite exporter TauE/SafE family protein [Usitatibacteraceae bacterium]